MKGKLAYESAIVLLFAGLACALQALRGIVGVQLGMGFSLDLVAVPALLAFFLYGLRNGLAVLLLTSVFIAFSEPAGWLGAAMKLAATIPMIAVPAFYSLSMKRGFGAGKPVMSMFFALFIALFAFVAWEAVTAPLPPAQSLGWGAGGLVFAMPLGSFLIGLLPLAAVFAFALGLIPLWERNSRGLSPFPFEQPRLVVEVLLVAFFIRCTAMAVATYYCVGPAYWGVSPYAAMAAVPIYAVFAFNIAQGALEMFAAWVIVFKLGLERYAAWQAPARYQSASPVRAARSRARPSRRSSRR